MVSWYVPRGTLTSSALPSASDSVKLVITVSLAYLMYTDAKPTGLRLSESRTFRSMLNELPLSIDSSITIWEKAPTAGISSKTRSNISFFVFIFVVLSWKIIMQLFVLCAANITIIFSYATNYISYILPSLMFIPVHAIFCLTKPGRAPDGSISELPRDLISTARRCSHRQSPKSPPGGGESTSAHTGQEYTLPSGHPRSIPRSYSGAPE